MIILENRKGAGRKPSPPNLLKIPISLKLPRWLIEWMDGREESRAVLIETAILAAHKITPPKTPHEEFWQALDEIEQLRAENAALREEAEKWWEEAHGDACTNTKSCVSYGGNKECYRPRPEILKRPTAYKKLKKVTEKSERPA